MVRQLGERRWRYCQRVFSYRSFSRVRPSAVGAECQRKRRTEYHRKKIAADPEYREMCAGTVVEGVAPAIRLLDVGGGEKRGHFGG
jgi:hypothetical protein